MLLVIVGCVEVACTQVAEEKLAVSCFYGSYCWLLLLVVACCWLCSEVPCTWVAEEKLVVGCWLLLVVLKLLVLRWLRRSW